MTPAFYPILPDITAHLNDVGFIDINLTSQPNRAVFTYIDRLSNHYTLKLVPTPGHKAHSVIIEDYLMIPSECMATAQHHADSYSLMDAYMQSTDRSPDDRIISTNGTTVTKNIWSLTCTAVRVIGLADLDKAIDNRELIKNIVHWRESSYGYPGIEACKYETIQNIFGSVGIAISISVQVHRKYSKAFNYNEERPEDYIEPVLVYNDKIETVLLLRVDGRLVIKDDELYYTGIMPGEDIATTKFFQTV